MLILSCSKEGPVQAEVRKSVEAVVRNPSNGPFFDQLYAYNALNIQSDRVGTYPFVDQVMAELQNTDGESSIFSSFRQQNIFPC